jgi:hypothetical protein
MSKVVTIPYNFTPRDYQKNLYNAIPQGFRRGCTIWHRRAGKDKTFMNILAREACQRVGTYFYILPFYAQARIVIWESYDKDGFRTRDHIPPQIQRRIDNQKMTIELTNGSMIRFLGSDNIDSIVGSNPIGVLFSEFSLHKPQAWDYLRPILIENDGWAFFNGTPRGRNHLYDMYKKAKKDPNWYCETLTVDDTGVMTPEQIQSERDDGMPEPLIQQEFYCSFDASILGSYYGDLIQAQSHIQCVPYDPMLEVHTAWDLGMSDNTTIVFFQTYGQEVRFIDCYSNYSQGLAHYVKVLKEKPYVYGYHALPHDVQVRELSTGYSRLRTLRGLGLDRIRVIPKAAIEDGINAVRQILPRCYFDKDKCDDLVEALIHYHSEYSDKHKILQRQPVHDWSSHYADAVRMAAQSLRVAPKNPHLVKETMAIGTKYNPMTDNRIAMQNFERRSIVGYNPLERR